MVDALSFTFRKVWTSRPAKRCCWIHKEMDSAMKNSKPIILVVLALVTFVTAALKPNAVLSADDRYVLQYDTPAIDDSPVKRTGRARGLGYIQTALPLGNGRLGAMFSGGIETEHLLINDITLWMNAKRGLDEVTQSGTRLGAYKHLETVRQAYRDGKYGTKPGSMEGLSTKYLSSTQPLGGYAPFTDCIEASTVLGRDESFRKTLQEFIPKLCPQKIGQYGQLQEWPEDWDRPRDKHRHISHLIALHPGRDLSPLTTPELHRAALVTMHHRGDESTGWSTGWKTCFWARLHNGDKAHQIYRFLTAKRAYPNLFDF